MQRDKSHARGWDFEHVPRQHNYSSFDWLNVSSNGHARGVCVGVVEKLGCRLRQLVVLNPLYCRVWIDILNLARVDTVTDALAINLQPDQSPLVSQFCANTAISALSIELTETLNTNEAQQQVH